MSVLLHIGYHKTATTWLQTYLFRHEQAGLRTVGKSKDDHPARLIVKARPLEFDAEDFRAQFAPLLAKVEGQGLLPVVSNERLSGHPSSGGYDSKEIADRLAAVFPGAKVLIVVREQRSMIRSVYKQYVLSGGPCTFETYVETAVDPDARVPTFDFRFFEYEHLIRYYRSRFGDDAVLVLPYEGFVNDPAGFVESIGQFAGRPVGPEVLGTLPFGKTPHRTPSTAVIEVTRFGNRLARRSDYQPAPLVDSPWLFKRVQTFARGDVLKKAVPQRLTDHGDAELKRQIDEAVGDRYRESNRATAALTGLDLAGYGWTV